MPFKKPHRGDCSFQTQMAKLNTSVCVPFTLRNYPPYDQAVLFGKLRRRPNIYINSLFKHSKADIIQHHSQSTTDKTSIMYSFVDRYRFAVSQSLPYLTSLYLMWFCATPEFGSHGCRCPFVCGYGTYRFHYTHVPSVSENEM